MPADVPLELWRLTAKFGQEHLWQWWPVLTPEWRTELLQQIRSINFAEIARELSRSDADENALSADKLRPPSHVVERNSAAHSVTDAPVHTVTHTGDGRTAGKHSAAEHTTAEHTTADHTTADHTDGVHADAAACRRIGRELLEAGRVAVITVAGGMGSRLGFHSPKGLFPIGPVTGKTLYQWFAERIAAWNRRTGRTMPYIVMTSSATHDATVEAFTENDNWGLPDESVYFVQQGDMPAADRETGRLLLQAPHRLALSPDGHGGLLAALSRSGLLDVLAEHNIEHIFYHQIDNPAVSLCDPEFLGRHANFGGDVSVRVIRKRRADERVGVLAEDDSGTRIVEYSDMPPEIAAEQSPPGSGKLRLWAGNTAIHIFRCEFLRRCIAQNLDLPWHRAVKSIPHLNENGAFERPQTPNAIKLERFIFDLFPHANRVLLVEADRDREYLPVKNKQGENSPATAREGLSLLARERLGRLGIAVAEGVPVEIDPDLEDADLQANFGGNGPVTEPTYFTIPRSHPRPTA